MSRLLSSVSLLAKCRPALMMRRVAAPVRMITSAPSNGERTKTTSPTASPDANRFTKDGINRKVLVGVAATIFGGLGLGLAWQQYKEYNGERRADWIRARKPIKYSENIDKSYLQLISPKYESLRKDAVDQVGQFLDIKRSPNDGYQLYGVTLGPAGSGKSLIMKTVACTRPHVIITGTVWPGMSAQSIVDLVVKAITGTDKERVDSRFARKVIMAFNAKGDKSLSVIIPTATRPLDKPAAELAPAVRSLVEDYGLNVMIDASENAYPLGKLTKREVFVTVESMPETMITDMPQFKVLESYFNEKPIDKRIVLDVSGGLPVLINQLSDNFIANNANSDAKKKEDLVRGMVNGKLGEARKAIKVLLKKCPGLTKVLVELETKPSVPYHMINDLDVDLNDVLRVYIDKDGKQQVIPASGAVAVLLRLRKYKPDTAEVDFDDLRNYYAK